MEVKRNICSSANESENNNANKMEVKKKTFATMQPYGSRSGKALAKLIVIPNDCLGKTFVMMMITMIAPNSRAHLGGKEGEVKGEYTEKTIFPFPLPP